MIRRLASLHWLQPGTVHQFHGYHQDALTSCRPSRRPSLPSIGGTTGALVSFRSRHHRVLRCAGLELVTRYLQPGFLPRRRQDLPSSWGTPIVRLRMFFDADRTACTRPVRSSNMAPAGRTTKAPAKGLSTLNSMAFGLAVYASQHGLPRHHARLASGRWSDATGRASHPQGSVERFQFCFLTSHPPFPSFAWRNRPDRSNA